jgi:hypothetical protein
MKVALLPAVLIFAASAYSADAITLRPDEAASKDVFVYAFEIPGTLGVPPSPNVTNLDSTTLNALAPNQIVPFGAFLGAAETEAFTIPPDPTPRAHTTRTLIGFDLSGVSIAPGQVRSATLSLFALPGLPPFADPTPDSPVTLDLKPVIAPWEETVVTWETRPEVGAVATSAVLEGVNRRVNFDVSNLVRQWIMDPDSNNGVEISQRAIVAMSQGPGERDLFTAALFASSAFADPEAHPTLTITPVPVPAAGGLLVGALALIGAVARFRRR